MAKADDPRGGARALGWRCSRTGRTTEWTRGWVVADRGGPARRGPYENGRRRRAQIIEHATEVFATRGLAGGSLRKIADRVEVTPASLLRHFAGKEELLVEVLRHWDEHQVLNEQRTDGVEFFESLRGLTRINMERGGLLQLYITLGMEATDPRHPANPFIVARQARTLESFRRNLQHGIERGELAAMDPAAVDAESRLLLALLDGLALQWLLSTDMDLAEAIGGALDDALLRWRADLSGAEDAGAARPGDEQQEEGRRCERS